MGEPDKDPGANTTEVITDQTGGSSRGGVVVTTNSESEEQDDEIEASVKQTKIKKKEMIRKTEHNSDLTILKIQSVKVWWGPSSKGPHCDTFPYCNG